MARGRHVIKDGSLVRFASDIEMLAEKVFKHGTRREKLQLIRDILPYVYRRQPQEVWNAGADGKTLPAGIVVTIVRDSSDVPQLVSMN